MVRSSSIGGFDLGRTMALDGGLTGLLGKPLVCQPEVLNEVTDVMFQRERRQQVFDQGQLLAGVGRRIHTRRHLRLRLRSPPAARQTSPYHSASLPSRPRPAPPRRRRGCPARAR